MCRTPKARPEECEEEDVAEVPVALVVDEDAAGQNDGEGQPDARLPAVACGAIVLGSAAGLAFVVVTLLQLA
jgi:hypothetical protein